MGTQERESTRGEDAGSGGGGAASRWEWVAAGVSLLILLGVLGFLLYDAVDSTSTPPRVEVVVDSVGPAGPAGFLVTFTATNSGDETAGGVLVQGELRSDTGLVESAEATLSYVPSHSSRSGGLIFQHDPRRYALQVRPRGYDRP